jgi:Zn-dependent metalloprotease
MKEYIVDKVDEFLQYKGHEIYEQAKRDVLSDPRMAEHKVALEKIIDVARSYMTEEEAVFASTSKVEESRKESESLKHQMKILESKNARLAYENTKLNENVKAAEAKVLTEAAKVEKVEKKERIELGKKASGRGEVVIEESLIAEYGVKDAAPKKTSDVDTSRIDESSDYYDALRLAGVVVPD